MDAPQGFEPRLTESGPGNAAQISMAFGDRVASAWYRRKLATQKMEKLMQVSVQIGDESFTVNVRQISTTEWLASGEFKGTTVVVKDSSQDNAVDRWRKVAPQAA